MDNPRSQAHLPTPWAPSSRNGRRHNCSLSHLLIKTHVPLCSSLLHLHQGGRFGPCYRVLRELSSLIPGRKGYPCLKGKVGLPPSRGRYLQILARQFGRVAAGIALFAALIAAPGTGALARGVTVQLWGRASTGPPVLLYTLTDAHGLRATITNFGGIVTSLSVPDRHGKFADIVLGYDNLAQYEKNVNNPYFGAIIGRYGNRIAGGQFVLDGKVYQLAKNNAPNNLHGGPVGFDRKVWDSHSEMTRNGPSVVLTLSSKDGDMMFPGNLNVRVVYTLTDDDELKVQYTAEH